MNTLAARLLVVIAVVHVSVLAWGPPAHAQLLADDVQEPRITRESRQRAVAAMLTHPGSDLAGQAGTSTSPDWSQVMALAGGTAITVTQRGEGARREFVAADDTTLTVRDFRRLTNVEVLARRDIAEVYAVKKGQTERSHRRARGVAGAILGSFGAGFLGGMAGFAITDDDSNLSGMFFGMVGGSVAGGILGYRAAAGPAAEATTVLIYRAPVRVIP